MQSVQPDFAGNFFAAFNGSRNMLAQMAQAPRQGANALATYGESQPQGYASPATQDGAPDDPIARGIIEAAQAGGWDPVDLATAISYETAGTFDPTKRGPQTQWGQHRGFIQFGEPQAREYGVDWNDPIGSQLGAKGAVVNYLRGRGVKPGMGLLDIYSAINAGAPGLYGRSDANNGGAPGTVRDKVTGQMAGHRRKAEALLGPYLSRSTGRDHPTDGGRFDVSSFLQYL